jgi:hypothetical protein
VRAGWLKEKEKKKMGCCCCCWAGLERGKGLREKEKRFWDFRDLEKKASNKYNSNLNLNSSNQK